MSDILPNSDKKPYILFGSTNFCMQCRQALSIFRSLEKQLNDVGVGTAEFNVNDQRLSNELGILNAPSLCVISQRRVYHFDDQGKINSYSENNIKEFLRKSIPIQRYIRTVIFHLKERRGDRRHDLLILVEYIRRSVSITFII